MGGLATRACRIQTHLARWRAVVPGQVDRDISTLEAQQAPNNHLRRCPTMSAPRLTFLYPILFRPIQAAEKASLRTAQRRLRPHEAGFSTASRRRQDVRPERYVAPNDPPLHLDAGARRPIAPRETTPAAKKEQQSAQTETAKETRLVPPPSPNDDAKRPDADPSSSPPSAPAPSAKAEPGASEATSAAPSQTAPETTQANALETILQAPSPSEDTHSEDEKPPHLDTPPYVHHFDTFSLVKDLENGDLSQDQSVTLMKAVRGILADNMELARRALVTKSDVENVCITPCYPIWTLARAQSRSRQVTPLDADALSLHCRKPISSAPHAANSVPRYRTTAKLRLRRCAPSARSCSTKSTS